MHTDVFLRSVLIGVTCIEETAEREGLLIGDWTLFICVYILLDILRLSLVSEQTIFELYQITLVLVGEALKQSQVSCKGHFTISYVNLLALFLSFLALLETVTELRIFYAIFGFYFVNLFVFSFLPMAFIKILHRKKTFYVQ